MAELGLFCRVCKKQTMHRSRISAFSRAILLMLAVAVFAGPRGDWAIVVLCLAIIPFAFFPPEPIRCQTCGGVTSRHWAEWIGRLGFIGVVALLVLASTPSRDHGAPEAAPVTADESVGTNRSPATIKRREPAPAPAPPAPTALGTALTVQVTAGGVPTFLWRRADHAAIDGVRGEPLYSNTPIVIWERQGRRGYPDEAFRVRLADGREGWVDAARVEHAEWAPEPSAPVGARPPEKTKIAPPVSSEAAIEAAVAETVVKNWPKTRANLLAAGVQITPAVEAHAKREMAEVARAQCVFLRRLANASARLAPQGSPDRAIFERAALEISEEFGVNTIDIANDYDDAGIARLLEERVRLLRAR